MVSSRFSLKPIPLVSGAADSTGPAGPAGPPPGATPLTPPGEPPAGFPKGKTWPMWRENVGTGH